MQPLNRHHIKFPSKTDHKMIENGRRLENWWEEVGDVGKGKLKQNLQIEIFEAKFQYLDDQEDKLVCLNLVKPKIGETHVKN